MAESRVRYRLANGPRRAQSKAVLPSILRRMAYVSCRGYTVSRKAHGIVAVNQGGTADFDSSLAEQFCLGRFLFASDSREENDYDLTYQTMVPLASHLI